MKRIEILFENAHCLVLNKPAGLAVQGGEGVENSLDRILEAEFSPRPLLVHRLDKDTSGLILAAKNREAAARFSALFAGRGGLTARGPSARTPGMRKLYLAVCAGCPQPAGGIIRLNLEVRGGSREAETGYRVLGSLPLPGGGSCSRLELELGTGRTHQIRRHLARIGHPVLGDDKYGDFALNKALRKNPGLKRLLLHAFRLYIPESLAGFPGGIDISAPPPEYFAPFGPLPCAIDHFFTLDSLR
ncbi:MAG: RluA family pseudouridine synthase [Treponema sp.]|jgi:23S rRNA pseudouridine955/2504/2580 synthase|nr:RluA family pseudouridine synthase [Treponema sp.]